MVGKKLTLNYGNADYGQVFWDQDGNVVTGIHENDGDFREEYMSELLTHFNIDVKYHQEIPSEIKKKSKKHYGVW